MSEMWDAVAGGWAEQADFVDHHLAAVTERFLDAAGIEPGSDVLEVGCGPGGAGIMAAERVGPTGTVVLADVAPAMVAVAGRRSAGLPQVSTLVCDQLAIDAADDSFDAVICRHGLMFAAEPSVAVREALRVLRPGGRYAAMTWAPKAANPWLGNVLDAVGEELGSPFPPPGIAGPFSLDDPDGLTEVLIQGGAADVQVDQRDSPLPAASFEAWWQRVQQLAGPLALVLASLEPAVREGIRRRALDHGQASAQVTDTGVVFPGSVLIAAGRCA